MGKTLVLTKGGRLCIKVFFVGQALVQLAVVGLARHRRGRCLMTLAGCMETRRLDGGTRPALVAQFSLVILLRSAASDAACSVLYFWSWALVDLPKVMCGLSCVSPTKRVLRHIDSSRTHCASTYFVRRYSPCMNTSCGPWAASWPI